MTQDQMQEMILELQRQAQADREQIRQLHTQTMANGQQIVELQHAMENGQLGAYFVFPPKCANIWPLVSEASINKA